MAFFPLPASKVNATLFVARIHSAPVLFWCRADGRQVSTAREGQELLRDAAHTAREKLSKNTGESQSLLHRDTLGQVMGGPELWQT